MSSSNRIPRVLVLLATYNGEEFIDLQLKSIFEQNDVKVSILISDDCSSDGTLNIVSDYIKNNFSIKVLSFNKKFGSAASNFFYLVANSVCDDFDFIAFSDQDDFWFEKKIINAIDKINEKKVHGFSSDVIAYWPEDNTEKLIKKSYPQTSLDYFFESPGPGCSQVFTKESFLEFQKFVVANYTKIEDVDYHDWLIYAFYRHNMLDWHISDKPDMRYIQHAGNQIGANKGITAFISRIKMICSGWYPEQVELIYKIITNDDKKLLSNSFLFFNMFKIRRNLFQSIVAVFFLIIGRK
ncbi:glycosyltransferase [Gammaproteobacteria bacterium]|nr:glycosyltransferase [Gammaproteobacteria bacterium]